MQRLSRGTPTALRVRLVIACMLLAVGSAAWGQVPSTAPATARAEEASEVDWYVEQLRNEHVEYREAIPCRAKLGEAIWIDVVNLDRWFADERLQAELKTDRPNLKSLVPVINGVPLTGLHPEYAWWDDDRVDGQMVKVCHLRFVLRRDEASRPAWARLLNEPVLERPLGVSIAFPGVDEISTNVLRGAPEPNHQFSLVVIPPFWLGVGVVLVLASLILFLYLAATTDIVRDVTSYRRPDGKRPYSLARAQMAFWFFLVIASYFFLWIITGDKDTITTTVLGLIGISAGTALGAAFVDASKGAPAKPQSDLLPRVDTSKSRDDVKNELRQLAVAARAELAAAEQARAGIPVADAAALQANADRQVALRARIEQLDWQADYFTWPPWKGVLHDLLGENNLISFHRFQIFVWTLVLGVIFCTTVYRELAMPEFNGTLLALMGISAGTYIGFKLPEPRS